MGNLMKKKINLSTSGIILMAFYGGLVRLTPGVGYLKSRAR